MPSNYLLRPVAAFAAASCTVLLAACGGGGGSSLTGENRTVDVAGTDLSAGGTGGTGDTSGTGGLGGTDGSGTGDTGGTGGTGDTGGTGGTGGTGDTGDTGTLTVKSFYDANANGQWDSGEAELSWRTSVVGVATPAFTPASYAGLALGSHEVREAVPSPITGYTWSATNAYAGADPYVGTPPASAVSSGDGYLNRYTATLSATTPSLTVYFGNVCLGDGGASESGYWISATELPAGMAPPYAALAELNLVDANGAAFDPADYTQLREWMRDASATNMAYMLSMHLATAKLNVLSGAVDPSREVYAPGAFNANEGGYMSLADLIAEAHTSLGANSDTRDSGPARDHQTLLKNALEGSNKNERFVQATPAACALNWQN